ncbi:MAG: transglutaminase family protein [Pseudorhodoplanes sp.]
MQIRAGYDIAFEFSENTAVVLMLSIHPDREKDLLSPHQISLSRDIPLHDYHDIYGNTCTRLVAPPGPLTISNSFLISDSGLPEPSPPAGRLMPVGDLPDDVLIYLLGSRYCDTQKLFDLALAQFDGITDGAQLVQAIVDYAYDRIEFGYHHARNDRTGFEAHEERIGVCRDFAHLAVTLCRCMNIPARYCTGYLGDIGVPIDPAPMDFSAWFEVYLLGQWYTFDARHNEPRIGRIVMARGRDAADVAISTAFGKPLLTRFEVVTDEVADTATSDQKVA